MSQSAVAQPRPARRAKYVPAVGPRLKVLLWVIFVLAAALGANSLYLVAITAMEAASARWGEGLIYQNYFYQLMFLGHLVFGLLLTGPLLAFGLVHIWNARNRLNRRAVRIGYLLFATCLVLLGSGFVLMRVEGVIDVRNPLVRQIFYWLHVGAPVAALWLYVLHRLAGPRIKWRLGGVYGGVVAALVIVMVMSHAQDPRKWNVAGPVEGEKYFYPSLIRTPDAKFIPAKTLMMDHYCKECHADAHRDHYRSAHRFSSFNNPAYLTSVRETRRVALERDNDVKASRFCAGCHDPVPFLSGAFDDPKFDDVNHPTAHAGITCTVCHSVTYINSTRGNADVTIEEPEHYPFAFSENPILQYLNRQMVKAKPALHKKTFLKPLHKTAEFCSACHKVHLPGELTKYRDFLRGQNHYDAFLLSGVSGHGARSFYYPEVAKTKCADCHMNPVESSDFGAHLFADAKKPSIHNHMFLGANTAVSHWLGDEEAKKAHQKFLQDCIRVDWFGLKEGGKTTAPVIGPLRPQVPALQPGKSYLLEAVVRTLKLGHHLTQGTVDSNEIWVEAIARSGGRVIGRSGGIDQRGEVDQWSYFLNNFMLDRHGNRIDRRNAQDIFVALYDHQIPPGAAAVVHYRLDVPEWVTEPIEVDLHVHYRKFDRQYLEYIVKEHNQQYAGNERFNLPITTMASDRVVFPVAGHEGKNVPEQKSTIDLWQRWNDYGIGLFLEGERSGERGEWGHAAEAFKKVEALGRYDGPLNLARVLHRVGDVDGAARALTRSERHEPPAPKWTVEWFKGLIFQQRGQFEEAVASFRSILEENHEELRRRKFDFSKDYEVINELGLTLFAWGNAKAARSDAAAARELFDEAIKTFERTLVLDSENVVAHHNLRLIYDTIGDNERAAHHRVQHERYRPDEEAEGQVNNKARRNYPHASHAADGIAIYSLHRPGAPGIDRALAAPTPR
jgi:tetratricopeptide (TPR) repeat protein